MQKKNSVFKGIARFFKRIFRARSLIIISKHKVDHVPLSGVMQLLILVGFFGFFSGASYITGSYITARSVIKEKERKIASSTVEKSHIREEMDLLKRDLVRLNQNGNELNSYSKFIIGQHTDVISSAKDMTATGNNLFGQDTSKLLDRISFLEGRVNEIKNENEHLVTAIRERTEKKINYLEDVISMTGLDTESVEKAAESDAREASAAKSAASMHKKPEEASRKNSADHSENEGGPFIPDENNGFSSSEQELLANVDRLVMINEIVNSLPLAHPINDAQQMSPFGKRIDPINRRFSIHPGVDLAGPSGSRIFATNDGVVATAARKPAYGNMVDIEHKFGIVTRYAHMSQILVHEGDKVKKGQLIGVQGSTGRSTGPHLHYEVRIEDHPVNPVKFLEAGEYVLEE